MAYSRFAAARKMSATMARKTDRDIEKGYSTRQFVAKLRRLADALEKGRPFSIQVAGEMIRVPDDAMFNIEHEREGSAEEVEFQLKWKRAAAPERGRRERSRR